MRHVISVVNFNSIKVRLEQLNFASTRNMIANFNSIKVRLELMRGQKSIAERYQFQFHKGTIRTYYHFSTAFCSLRISIP